MTLMEGSWQDAGGFFFDRYPGARFSPTAQAHTHTSHALHRYDIVIADGSVCLGDLSRYKDHFTTRLCCLCGSEGDWDNEIN